MSDVHLTKHCQHGDLILADQGFTIGEAASVYCAEVKTP